MSEDTQYGSQIRSFSSEDLLSAVTSIDRDKHPERLKLVLDELARRAEESASKGASATPPPIADDLVLSVVAEMDAAANKKGSVLQNIGTLALTLIVFVSLGLFQNSISGVVILVGVLLLHECGHFVGMRLFGYKDVQMFFIPLFGAAVSGVETVPSGAKKAIVSLLGPVPGIVVGVVTGIIYLKTRQPLLADVTTTLLFLNVFNLLPFHPLDGGRFFDAVLFSRHPRVEIGFKVVTTLILGLCSYASHDFVLGIFAFLILMSLRNTYISATIAHAIRKVPVDCEDRLSVRAPFPYVVKIVGLLRERLSEQHRKPKVLANFVTDIWQRVRNRPCSVGAAIGLVVGYGFFVLVGVVTGVVLVVAASNLALRQEIILRTLENGQTIRLHTTSVQGHKLTEAQVNDEGFFDGPETGWDPSTANKVKEGRWKNGYWQGEWKFWDRNGELNRVIEFDAGKPVRYQQVINGQLQEVPPDQWLLSVKLMKQRKPERARVSTAPKEASKQVMENSAQ